MRTVIVLALQALLLCTTCVVAQHIDSSCRTDSNCDSWLACRNGKCTACAKESTTCIKNATGFLSQCCAGTTCEPIPGLNSSHCVSNNNNCRRHADCPHELNCLRRLGKCGYCHYDGKECTLPYDNLECCSSYCGFSSSGKTYCADPNPSGPSPARIKVYAAAIPPVAYESNVSTIPCSTTSDCGTKKCLGNWCSKCQRLYTFCTKSSDCCSNICTASHNHVTTIVAGVIRKICVAPFHV
jgi:hypothetical protein